MTHMTPEETKLLRQTLGLSFYCRENPTRNLLRKEDSAKHPEALQSLLAREFLIEQSTIDQSGRWSYYKATDAGRFGVFEQPWKG